jgi:LacI family transcriptional regulator
VPDRTAEPPAESAPADGADPRLRQRASMRQVAEHAGVAMSSVSRVLSEHPDVSARMRERVLAAVEELGYEPDLLAQSLRRGATQSVGFVVGDISNPLLSEIALGAEVALRKRGYSMLVTNSEGRPDLDARHIRLFQQRRVDALLLSLADETDAETRRALAQVEVPVVLIDRDVPGIDASQVLSDHRGGIRAAAEHLIRLGHRRIGLLAGSPELRPTRERAEALEATCGEFAGVEAAVRAGSYSAEHGERACAELLDGPGAPTALIAGGNQILVGVLRTLRARGLRVPDDVSLVTCDEVPLSAFLEPPIAAITRDPRLIGQVGAELLLGRLAGGAPRRRVLETRFTPRPSCAAPAGGPARPARRRPRRAPSSS